MNPNEWKQRGRVSIWSYDGSPRNYPGWHLNCDQAGAASLISLVKALLDSQEDAHRTVVVTGPAESQLAVPNCRATPSSPQRLVVKIAPEWRLSELAGKLELCFPREMGQAIIEGLQGLVEGKGDYSIGENGCQLWFWW